ncbi:hypothetical protein [Oryzomonas rubra]|uniref:Uncharacterized protein n=1 Tax=Oryzomonas rubra TaxID=2509454 RepID=A0A5A9XBP8_9BACT|nr:hypothetical protein [Oryzomonas rubra]KAA0890517.1 hypothetical protein ET418_12740 [Oryzomonas rubra]
MKLTKSSVLYRPRWLAVIPLVVLLPLATYSHGRSLIPLSMGAFIIFGSFMGVRLGPGKAYKRVKGQPRDQVQRIVDMISHPVIISGNFNMPTDSAIFLDVWGKYADAFSVAGFGYGLTQRAILLFRKGCRKK